MTPNELDNLTFHQAELTSPTGGRYLVVDGDGDLSRGPYLWLAPLGQDGRPTGNRRRKLFYDDAASWRPWGEDPDQEVNPNDGTVHVEIDMRGMEEGEYLLHCSEDEALDARGGRLSKGRYFVDTYLGELYIEGRTIRAAVKNIAAQLGYKKVVFTVGTD